MKKNIFISVSTDPIQSYQEIVEYAKSLQGEADFLHCDVMDGKFVPKMTYDYNLIKTINANCLLPLDVHLMVEQPKDDIKKYIDAVANIITLHYEAFEDKKELVNALKMIKSSNCLAGISFKPETSFKEIKPYCYDVDVILIMSVTPGASGQKFGNYALSKIREIDSFRKENQLNFKIEIDGGVNLENAKLLTGMGVDILVSGSCVYKAANHAEVISALR